MQVKIPWPDNHAGWASGVDWGPPAINYLEVPDYLLRAAGWAPQEEVFKALEWLIARLTPEATAELERCADMAKRFPWLLNDESNSIPYTPNGEKD
jgi:hypothetical protein